MTTSFNLDAPIVSRKSVADLQLGDALSNILEQAMLHTIARLTQRERYYFGSMVLCVSSKGKSY